MIFTVAYEIVEKLKSAANAYYNNDESVISDEEYDKFKFKDHPDMKYLRALSLYKKNDFTAAKAIFDEIYPIYENNHNQLNNKSEFLFNYINIHKFFQNTP